MARRQDTQEVGDTGRFLLDDKDMLRDLVRQVLQEFLEAEMDECLGAGRYERSSERRGHRSGYYSRSIVTRVGKIALRVPQDRAGRFNTELFERYERSEKALVLALMEMYVKGVSTRKVRAVTEELCGHSFSASTISRLNKRLDSDLAKFASRGLEEPYPYLILDARYEKVRECGVVRSQAVQIAIGVNEAGHRCILGGELAQRESASSWRTVLQGLRSRGLHGVEFVVSDDHAGLRRAISELLPEAVWQRCYVHFRRNARDYLPRKNSDDCITELSWIYDRRDACEARQDLAAWLGRWGNTYPKLCDWVESNIEETLSFYRLPREHHKHMKSTNMLERYNEELRRRTRVVRIFPNGASCLRLIRAMCAEQHEEWSEGTRYLDMVLWREHKRALLREAQDEAA